MTLTKADIVKAKMLGCRAFKCVKCGRSIFMGKDEYWVECKKCAVDYRSLFDGVYHTGFSADWKVTTSDDIIIGSNRHG